MADTYIYIYIICLHTWTQTHRRTRTYIHTHKALKKVSTDSCICSHVVHVIQSIVASISLTRGLWSTHTYTHTHTHTHIYIYIYTWYIPIRRANPETVFKNFDALNLFRQEKMRPTELNLFACQGRNVLHNRCYSYQSSRGDRYTSYLRARSLSHTHTRTWILVLSRKMLSLITSGSNAVILMALEIFS